MDRLPTQYHVATNAGIDGVVNARRGTSRTEVITEILREWADAKVHESIVVLRIRGINPTEPEGNRK